MTFPSPLTHKQRCAMFGSFTFTPAPTAESPERVIVDPEWARARIVTIEVPQMISNSGPGLRKVQMHKLAADDFLALFDAWDKAGLMPHVVTFNGGWVARYKRGKAGGTDKDLSNHSWGTAFDINAKWNGLGKTPAPTGSHGSVLALVPIAESMGWAWGGRWKTPDGMHFERCAL